MKVTAQKIKEYFQAQKAVAHKIANEHIEMGKKAKFKTEKKRHEDWAWEFGVRRIAMLNDMEKDILKIV